MSQHQENYDLRGIPSMLLFYGHHIYFVIFVLAGKKIQILIHVICES